MSDAIPLKSKTTGLVGMYPPEHLELDPDLEQVEDVPCLECQQESEANAKDKKEK